MPPHASAEIGAPVDQHQAVSEEGRRSRSFGGGFEAERRVPKIEKPKGAAVPTIV
jgi:hypothetical protein